MLKKQSLIHKICFYGDVSWQSLPLLPLLTRKGHGREIPLHGTASMAAGDLSTLSINSP